MSLQHEAMRCFSWWTCHRYLGQTAEDVTVPSICPFPQEPNTAVIAVSVSGANFPLTHGYSIVHTDNGGRHLQASLKVLVVNDVIPSGIV